MLPLSSLHHPFYDCLIKNPPPAPGSLFLGVASRSASGRDLTRVPKTVLKRVGQQPAIFKKQFGGSNIATHFLAGTIELFKNDF